TEQTLHGWDVRVSFDTAATLPQEATGPLLEGSAELLGGLGKSDPLEGRHAVIEVRTIDPASVFALRLTDPISADAGVPAEPDGTLTLAAETWLRLVAGPMAPWYTPAGVAVTGAADLDLLRRVFPGY